MQRVAETALAAALTLCLLLIGTLALAPPGETPQDTVGAVAYALPSAQAEPSAQITGRSSAAVLNLHFVDAALPYPGIMQAERLRAPEVAQPPSTQRASGSNARAEPVSRTYARFWPD